MVEAHEGANGCDSLRLLLFIWPLLCSCEGCSEVLLSFMSGHNLRLQVHEDICISSIVVGVKPQMHSLTLHTQELSYL